MKASDYIAHFLKEAGCTHVFGVPGGAVTHLVDSLYRCPGIRFIGAYHEQAAAFAAEGYARRKNGIGVAIATSGPGATNLITGIGSAWFDSIPCLYITGQVNTYEYKGGRRARQIGFQETDIVSIVKSVVKYAVRITDAGNIRHELEKAVAVACSGRKGPVLLDIPMDIQRTEIDVRSLAPYEGNAEPKAEFSVDDVIRRMNGCARPVILAGGGVQLSGATEALGRVADKLQIPVVSSLMGRDAYDNVSELYLGMIGTYGNRCANLAIANSDLILALGTRLDTRQTGTNPSSFARGAVLIRVDVDEGELENRIKPDEIAIQADAGSFLTRLEERLGEIHTDTSEWLGRVLDYKRRYLTAAEDRYPNPNHIMEAISGCLGPQDTVCLDVGQNQMWAAQSLRITGGQRLLACGGMGAMGFALPCAVGAYYCGSPGRVLAIAGDGGMQMNIQELELIRRNHIPLKIIVLNNRSLGMIRQFQESYFESRFAGTVIDYAAPDFCAVAAAYGIPSLWVASPDGLLAMQEALACDGPMLIEIVLPQDTHVFPKLSVNRPIEEQEPLLERGEFLRDMIVPPYEAVPGDTKPYAEFIRETFDRLKRKRAGDPLKLLMMYDDRNGFCGYLMPVTADYRESIPGCAALLARWRNENMAGLSAEPFVATAEGTEKWLDALVLGRDDRVLFLIVAPGGGLVGHIGYSCFGYGSKSCDVDAVLRGEKKGYPGIMAFALRALIAWGIGELKLDAIGLSVFSDNLRAVEFYKRNGFMIENADVHESSGRGSLRMKLDLEAWKKKYQSFIRDGDGEGEHP